MRPDVARIAWVGGLALGALAGWPWLPAPAPVSAPSGQFSAGRAAETIAHVAAAPRPPGSAAHDAVRDWLVVELQARGLEVASRPARWAFDTGRVSLVTLEARAPGDAPRPWLVAHYDSVPAGPGAGDDAVGVAVALEVGRALAAAGEPPVNVLLTDGEELGLLGARSWFKALPQGTPPGLVLNLEARGNRGAAYMFQTAGDAGELMSAWTDAGCRAQSTSLARRVYELLPNDTDFTVVRAHGWLGYDFALIGGAWAYHHAEDTPAGVAPGSVQQLGSCALGLVRVWTRRLAGGPPPADPGAAWAWGQVLGWTWRCPAWLLSVVSGITLVWALGQALAAWRRGERWGMARGFLAVPGAATSAGLVCAVGGAAALPTSLDPATWRAELEHPEPLYAAAALVALGITALLARARPTAGTTAGWALATALVAAGAVAWAPETGAPLVVGPLALLAGARRGGSGSGGGVLPSPRGYEYGPVVGGILAGVAAATVTPVIVGVFLGLTTALLPVLAVVVVVLAGWVVVGTPRAP